MHRFCVIIGAYNPPDKFYDTVKKLVSLKIDTFIVYSGNDINLGLESEYIRMIKEKNYGLGHKFNTGINLAKDSGFDLVTILTDDVSVLPNFSANDIINYYSKYCSENDILHLDFVSDELQTTKYAMDRGMTFSTNIGDKIKFRNELVMDQQDIYFCYKLETIGGRIISFNKKILNTLPVGRAIKWKMHFLPSFRVYLLTRNTLRLFIETKNFIFFKGFLYFATYYSLKAVIGREKNVFYAYFAGIFDALRGKLGITENLKRLSENKFP